LELMKPFELLADHVALDFVNTLDGRFAARGPTELLTSYDRLLAFSEQAGLLNSLEARRLKRAAQESNTQQALKHAKELREALFTVFAAASRDAPPSDEALDILNQWLAEDRPARVVAWEDGHFAWQTEGGDLDLATLLGRIAEAAAELLTSPDVHHIKECGSPTCRWLFLDRTRNHSRRWCDMRTCGNRIKARRFRGRSATERPGEQEQHQPPAP
jgi:predicted RNA-binding Zn ribbon-like protein